MRAMSAMRLADDTIGSWYPESPASAPTMLCTAKAPMSGMMTKSVTRSHMS